MQLSGGSLCWGGGGGHRSQPRKFLLRYSVSGYGIGIVAGELAGPKGDYQTLWAVETPKCAPDIC